MATDTETRQRIVDHARDRFMVAGFTKVTLDEIATELGMSKKTLYKFFQSKEELAKAGVTAMLQHIEKMIERIVSSDRSSTEKIIETMLVVGRQVSRFGRESQINLRRTAPELWKMIEEFRREQIFSKVGRIFHQAKAEGVIRAEIDEQILLLVFLNAVQGIVNPEVLSQSPFTMEQAFRNIIAVVFQGALTDEGRKQLSVISELSTTLS